MTQTKQSNMEALKPLALLAAGMNGADIERLVRELRGRSRRRGDPHAMSISWTDLEQALLTGKNVPSIGLARCIAIHELGHAIAYECLGVARVTLVRVGGEKGGETRTALNSEAVQEEDGVMRWIACLLAGQAAEKLFNGRAMMGAGGSGESDLARATALALDLETGFGVAADMPLLYRRPANPTESLLYNPLLAERVNKRLKLADEMARNVLGSRKEVIAKLADVLAREIVIDGHRLRAAIQA
jgi:cell division protease FtsH